MSNRNRTAVVPFIHPDLRAFMEGRKTLAELRAVAPCYGDSDFVNGDQEHPEFDEWLDTYESNREY